ncbi:MAG: hypothetical protein Tsb0013_00240 [Phycisphaerales bacterium]
MPTPPRANGFTMVEAIVVVVLLGVVAGLTAPRLMNNDARRADAAVESVAGVLDVIAQREALGTVRMALAYDAEERSLRLERLAMPTDDDGRIVAITRRNSGEWKPDPLAPDVTLGPLRVQEVRVDGDALDDDSWRLEFVPGEARPLIEMDLAAFIGGRDRTWRVELLPFAAESEHWSTTSGDRRDRDALESVDLEDLGLSEIPW